MKVFKKIFKIGNRKIGPGQPVFIICEAGVTNYGKFSLAKKQIDAAVVAGADAVKFQLWRTENLVSKKVAKRLVVKLGHDWFKRLKYKELSHAEIKKLSRYAKKRGIMFFATPHDEESINYLAKVIKVSLLKVGSGESHNYEFLKKIGSAKKPVIISFGMQTNQEIKKAVSVLKRAGATSILPMHCVTMYPVPYDMANLPRLEVLRKILKMPIGLSDHTAGYHVLLAAVAYGAVALEKHLTFDKKDPRSLDNPGALLPGEFKEFVKMVRQVESALNAPQPKKIFKFLQKSRHWAGQAIVAVRAIKKGERIKRNMLAFKRPAFGGLAPEMIKKIIGKVMRCDIPKDEQIKMKDIF